jgi:methyl-accepting chemotaxis protein
VQSGHSLVAGAGETMQEIVASVHKVSDLIGEIAAASQQQSVGLVQVNSAVAEMEHGVQQNVSLVQEAAQATASLAGQADALLQLVARFRVEQGEVLDPLVPTLPMPIPPLPA